MRMLLCSITCLFLLFTQPVLAEESTPHQSKKNLSIVIDDFGNNMKGTKDILNLSAHLTIAVMPFMPSTKADANLANENGHEVIVHMPMEPKSGKKSWLGPGAITTDLTDDDIRQRVEAAIKDVPHAVGMNNHMGSKVSEDERVMRIVLEVCKDFGIFYLDSKTTGNSVVEKLANEMDVPYLENHLFFDQVYTTSHIKKQANLLAQSLSGLDQVIAIGHVGVSGPLMYEVLNEYIPVYESMANIVPLSGLILEKRWIDSKVN